MGSGYDVLLNTVAATLDDSDPDAAQALRRAAVDVERFVAVVTAARDFVENEEGWQPRLTDRWYRLCDALGIGPGRERQASLYERLTPTGPQASEERS